MAVYQIPVKIYGGKEDAVGGQSMLERKAADPLLEEEIYQGAERGSRNDKTQSLQRKGPGLGGLAVT